MHSNLDYSTYQAISNSSLNLLEQSPKKFLKFYNLEFEEKDEKYFLLGSAIHCYILEPEEFNKRYKFLDVQTPNSANKKQFIEELINNKSKDSSTKLIEAYKKSYASANLKDESILEKAKELKKELSPYLKSLKYKEQGIDIVPGYLKAYLEKLKLKLKSNPTSKDLLFTEATVLRDLEVHNELPIFWETTKEGYTHKFKALLDRVMIDHDNKIIKLVDLKTTVDLVKFKEESFFKYHYDRQLAFYSKALMSYFESEYPDKNIEEYSIEHYIVAVNKDADPESIVFKISNNTILSAAKRVSELIDIAHWHFVNNKWEYSKECYENGYETI